MVFDGKSVGIHGRSVNGYAQFDAPGDLDDLFHALREGHGVALPAADFLLANSYDVLVAGVQEAKYMGRGVIDGGSASTSPSATSTPTGSSGSRSASGPFRARS